MFRTLIDVSLQLLDESSRAHILYNECIYLSPGPNDGTTDRKILKEENGVLKRPPPRPPMDCVVSRS